MVPGLGMGENAKKNATETNRKELNKGASSVAGARMRHVAAGYFFSPEL
jgi:hypothetical protein